MKVIRRERFNFEVYAKSGHSGKMDDVYTDPDKAAQAIYVRGLRECFPTYGIAAEEDGLSIPCTHELNIHFTVDPLDGTRAFIRQQSHGIGTMLSLICSGTVLGAYVGDVMSQEIYGSRPGSRNVWRFDESDRYTKPEKLIVKTSVPFEKRYVLLTDSHYKHSLFTQQLIEPLEHGGLFKGYNVMNGSIGTNMAQLWKSEVAAMVLQPHVETPWDFCPTYGISKKLGLVFCKIDQGSKSLIPYEPLVSPIKRFRPFEVLVVHENYVERMNDKIKKSEL
ncbi:MAG: hypothetical protein G01um101448_601 [Parcubacteria group bacterium Gr01-1014_48]|nr:MAG: hypothetical protein Greene041614_470 [Parcubacteria group bacterium Greene0416_14]TSC73712.1 MAG: hypothetical protein G01um101448_601 [Parcubacteria group bacterium Gr01-1014_48]